MCFILKFRPPVSFGIPQPPHRQPPPPLHRSLPRPPQWPTNDGGKIYDLRRLHLSKKTRPSTPGSKRLRRRQSRSLPPQARRKREGRTKYKNLRASVRCQKKVRCKHDLPIFRATPSWRAEEDTYATVRDDQLDGEGRELEVVVDQAPPEDEQHYQTPKLSR